MKILHAIFGLPIAAGTTTFVVGVANEMARQGHDVTVAVFCEPAVHDRALFVQAVKVVSMNSVIAASDPLQKFDIVHIHSMWDIWLHRMAVWCRKNKVPYVWSPHGSATPWAMRYKRWKKLLAWYGYQRFDFRHAVALHVTVPDEERDVRRLGMPQRVIVVPLGVSVPASVSRTPHAGRVFLFVSRIQKKKGLVTLIQAVAELLRAYALPTPDEVRFRIVGPDQEGHTAELVALAEKLGVLSWFDFVGPRYGAELSDEYDAADVFVLPTFSENFGVVVIDALAHGLPVITTKGAPWQALETYHCGWWVAAEVSTIAQVLREAMALPCENLREMGVFGRRFVEAHYTWSKAADSLVSGYREALC